MKIFDINNKDNLVIRSEDNDSVGCTACKNGICEDTGESCDACYENSMRLMKELCE